MSFSRQQFSQIRDVCLAMVDASTAWMKLESVTTAAEKSILEASRVEFVVAALVRMQAIFVEYVSSVGFCKSAEPCKAQVQQCDLAA